jgi:hypothetical protein
MVREGPVRRTPAVHASAVALVPDLVLPRHRAVLKASRRAKRTGIAADYHRLRIRCKRLRYSLEFTADLYPGHTEGFVRRMARLQDTLGLMQDAEVATGRLAELAIRTDEPLTAPTVFAMGRIAERYQVEADELLACLPRSLAALRGKQWEQLESVMERHRHEALAAHSSASLPAPAPMGVGAPTPSAAPAIAAVTPFVAPGAPRPADGAHPGALHTVPDPGEEPPPRPDGVHVPSADHPSMGNGTGD